EPQIKIAHRKPEVLPVVSAVDASDATLVEQAIEGDDRVLDIVEQRAIEVPNYVPDHRRQRSTAPAHASGSSLSLAGKAKRSSQRHMALHNAGRSPSAMMRRAPE